VAFRVHPYDVGRHATIRGVPAVTPVLDDRTGAAMRDNWTGADRRRSGRIPA
jgi:hypothetical protein